MGHRGVLPTERAGWRRAACTRVVTLDHRVRAFFGDASLKKRHLLHPGE